MQQLEESSLSGGVLTEAPEWVQEYNSALARRKYQRPVAPGPTCCSVCCTFFSSFGALFLFLVAALMRRTPPYHGLHIHGTDEEVHALSNPVVYAGFLYLLIAIYSLCAWASGNTRKAEWEQENAGHS